METITSFFSDNFNSCVWLAVMLVAMTFTDSNPVLLVILSALCGILYKSLQGYTARTKAEKGGNDK